MIAEEEWDTGKELQLSGVMLTMAGRELSRVVDLEEVPEFDTALVSYFSENGLEMVRAHPAVFE